MTPSRLLPLLLVGGAWMTCACAKQREYSIVGSLAIEGQARDGGVDASAARSDGGLPLGVTGAPTTEEADSSDETSGQDFGFPAWSGGATMGERADAGKPIGSIEVVRCADADECDDGNVCNGVERCESGRCRSGEVMPDGLECGPVDDALHVCRAGNCMPSRCGDGILDERGAEACDDGNLDDRDGCTRGCTFTCTADEECNDSNICNGEEVCDLAAHRCVAGSPLDDDTECGEGFNCRTGRCVSVACGDGQLSADEQCDDGNAADGDGCDGNCRYECWEDADCSDGNVCNGTETCDVSSHACQAGVALECDDGSACTKDTCEPKEGCTWTLIDGDGDGQAPNELGECGRDCGDDNSAVYAGAAELCDGLDNDCNGRTDEIGPTWYPDCDGDGYAPAGAEGVQQCEAPPSAPAECSRGSAGRWTSRTPTEAADCWDSDPAVYPGADGAWSVEPIPGRSELAYDYNCDGQEEQHYTTTGMKGDICLLIEPLLEGSTRGKTEIAPILCGGAEGWEGKRAPACGETGTYIYCNGCDRVIIEDYEQQCR